MRELEDGIIENKDHIIINKSSQDDIVQDFFKINIQEEIHSLSNDFCKYYHATHMENGKQFFAIVYEHNFVPPAKNIDFFSRYSVPGVNQVVAYGITRLTSTNAEHIVAIVNYYNHHNNLEYYAQNKGGISFAQVQDIIEKVQKALQFLNASNIYSLNINPINIIMENDKVLFIREPINSYPNFYQEPGYIAPELFECNRLARCHLSVNGDIFSLGVTIFYALTLQTPWSEYKNSEAYYVSLVEDSSYRYFANKYTFSDKLRKLLKGLTDDNVLDRWNLGDITEWINGNMPKAAHDSISNKDSNLTFNGLEYSNLKSLSYAFFQNWDESVVFLKDQKIYKWAMRQHFNPEQLDEIQKIAHIDSNTPFVMTNSIKGNIKLSKLLAIIDPYGALRHEKLALNPTRIPELIHHYVISGKKHYMESLINIVNQAVWVHYDNTESAGYLSQDLADNYVKSVTNIAESGIVNGYERLLYSLNPYAKCVSPILNGHYVISIQELIASLEHFAESNPKHLIIDRHILAFIASRLKLKSEIKSLIFSHFPRLADHSVILSLNVLNLLQQYEPNIPMSNICKIMARELNDLMDEYLHSISFKSEIKQKISDAAEGGDLSKILSLFTNQQLFINDHNGYHLANKQVQNLQQQIQKLNNKDHIFNNALLLGQKTTVFISYILCFIVTIFVII